MARKRYTIINMDEEFMAKRAQSLVGVGQQQMFGPVAWDLEVAE